MALQNVIVYSLCELDIQKGKTMRHLFTTVICTICKAILRKLQPDCNHADDIPMLVAWPPGDGHFCPYCKWTALRWHTVSAWYCPNHQCNAQFRSVDLKDDLTDLEITLPRQVLVPARKHSEKLRTGDLMRKYRTGEVSLCGLDELRWQDADERVTAGQLPAIPSWSYPEIR